jgi:outer membrane protein OmpA-like peptidoglycan-associated protein
VTHVRGAGLLGVLFVALTICSSGCAKKGSAVVVLLPDAPKVVGRADVQNKAGKVDLDDANEGARVKRNQRPTVFTLSDAEVQQMFGEALAALPPAPRRFVLNFRFESDELTDEARALVPGILSLVRERPFADVMVTGHTDTMGTTRANFDLGLKRALMVRNLLVSAGLEASQIQVTSLGETDLLIHTPDNTPEPRNRRVDIVVR